MKRLMKMKCNQFDCLNCSELGNCVISACTNPKYNGTGTITPPANVVPKSEYDKLQAENASLKQQLAEANERLGAAIEIIETAEAQTQDCIDRDTSAETVIETLTHKIKKWRSYQERNDKP